MPSLTTKDEQIHAASRQVARMADRVWRLGSPERRASYVAKARKRIDGGSDSRADAAIVVAADTNSKAD